MNTLTIDTSSIVASVAILNEEKLIGEMIINHQKKHSEKLMISVDHLLTDGGLSIKDIDVFGIVSGPGSFTGLRIGMATIKGFAQALNKPVVGVSTLEGLAMNIPFANGLVCPILDAQRNQTYTGAFHFEGGHLVRDMEDSVLEIDVLLEFLKNRKEPIYFLGDGLPRFSETLLKACPTGVSVPNYLNMNRASSAAALVLERALKGKVSHYREIEPVYIRPSYAEEHKK
ncbi:tRNA (adenosine(37)-N6)-threonylcarbamoyltransferase complex dimerization subunit type 1 TsaB [Acetobacterium paludosum]|uniref:tRNA (Adenosine(37)-N6)-threonylcarbamoyltransferase complex dimerization subunit type 1 TsaB n=1 Tax=Acetobacterium paludosum TaxID=52693 RepID=A0A923HUG1_9FIRM|nr:tRNA (adenosine(37)-N6)-threonylcarbamoyltransferase complex dimerization subunit type 1 TsaB [Acetobacterium paludosum]MBC3888526.1 tRNA (adenosine(37)-N6)-threonylcarbamoyltransferase complex dimerization subunit type 1 TsaB [Acetobacterium paludosum]